MISVCMATYNGEKYIKEQIDSILVQLNPDDELIISDDGSIDGTLDIIKEVHDPRIKLYNFDSHCYTKNFENALSQAKGDYIFLSDQDDIWIDGKVQASISALQDADLVVTDAVVINENKNILSQSYFKQLKVKTGFIRNVIATRYIGACMAFKKDVLKSVLPIPHNQYIAHDYWIACVCEKKYRVELINKPYIMYRRHTGNASTGVSGKSNMSVIKRVIKRFYLMNYLMGR